MKNKKKIGIFILVFLFLLILTKYYISYQVQQIEIEDIHFNNILDGTYVGKYSITPVSVQTEVTVHHHQITKIKILKHDNDLGKSAENIVDDVIEKQSLKVDAVSGATVSSQRILKSIENALEGDENE